MATTLPPRYNSRMAPKTQAEKIDATYEAVGKLSEQMTTLIAIVTSNSEQLVSINTELRDLHAEVRSISDRVDLLDEKVTGMQGYAKEIDSLRAEIAAIKKHLDLPKNVTA